MTILETERLVLRHIALDDVEMIHELLNEPAFLKNIGDKGVRTIADACQYILNGPIASYERHGFGLYLAVLKEDGTPVGMCGLVKRDALLDVDIGYAFLSRFHAKGYAFESASAVMAYAKDVLCLPRVVAIVAKDNEASIKVLQKLGLSFAGMIRLPGYPADDKLFTPDGQP